MMAKRDGRLARRRVQGLTRAPGAARFLAGLLLLTGGCGGGDATAPVHHVALELQVPAPQTDPGQWLSTFAEARLTVGADVDQAGRVLTAALDSTVSEVRFSLELDPGEYVMYAQIFSNNDAVLYVGRAEATIDEAAFVVPIDVDPVDAVILVRPGTPQVANLSLVVPLTIENVGIRDLFVTVQVSRDVALFCGPVGTPGSCSFFVTPSQTISLPVTADDILAIPGIEAFQLWLDSDVGRVTVDVPVPQG
ncbi:MAG: hypothetical protein P8177_11200 [Gemmatimonadota bacterium]